ncbi:MAG: acyl-CoA dehydrogenase family protein [Rhodobacterales bacterium]|nr:acyl-CoA dehydrogenase family protein [Rhodobacterales bacterium]
MTHTPPRALLGTHEVTNQPDAYGATEDVDLWATDPALRTHTKKSLAASKGTTDAVEKYGKIMGTQSMRQAGIDANRYLPELVSFDSGGRRLDEVRFHPAYHQLLGAGINAGFAAIAWEKGSKGGHTSHAAMVYLQQQSDPGVACPMAMTYAAVPALDDNPEISDLWVPRLTSRHYDPSVTPVNRKKGATLGMAMTEKQGGSDIRSNSTKATEMGKYYRLSGHKWFCSAPMSDGFLTLAQTKGGLTCFLVPRWLEGERNGIHVMALKDKLGNRSNASSEIEYHGALAHRIGDEGAGVKTIIDMVHHTRLDTAMAPAGLMRAALASAHHWTKNRTTFQKKLIDQPLMRSVLADLTLDWEGTLALGMRVAQAFDSKSKSERAFARLAVALAKYLGNKLAPNLIYEAMECLGGMGYTEATKLPLLYREAPLNSIWEGSGNIICLDILRTLSRDSMAWVAVSDELSRAAGGNRHYDNALAAHMKRWPKLPDESEARWFVENLATLLTASVLIQRAPNKVSDAYVKTRVAMVRGRTAGAISGVDTVAILKRLG